MENKANERRATRELSVEHDEGTPLVLSFFDRDEIVPYQLAFHFSSYEQIGG